MYCLTLIEYFQIDHILTGRSLNWPQSITYLTVSNEQQRTTLILPPPQQQQHLTPGGSGSNNSKAAAAAAAEAARKGGGQEGEAEEEPTDEENTAAAIAAFDALLARRKERERQAAIDKARAMPSPILPPHQHQQQLQQTPVGTNPFDSLYERRLKRQEAQAAAAAANNNAPPIPLRVCLFTGRRNYYSSPKDYFYPRWVGWVE